MNSNRVTALAQFLEPGEAVRLADAFAESRPVDLALAEVRASRRPELRSLVVDCLRDLDGDKSLLAAMLAAIGAAGHRNEHSVEVVWSGPVADGMQGRSTRAVAAELIDSATQRVHVATYSATKSSPYVTSLKAAIARGIEVTLVVDLAHQPVAVEMLAGELAGSMIIDLLPREDGQYAIMHAKLVLVDDRVALVTSANFSESAADRNLEAGVIVRDPNVVRGMREHLDALLADGFLNSLD